MAPFFIFCNGYIVVKQKTILKKTLLCYLLYVLVVTLSHNTVDGKHNPGILVIAKSLFLKQSLKFVILDTYTLLML